LSKLIEMKRGIYSILVDCRLFMIAKSQNHLAKLEANLGENSFVALQQVNMPLDYLIWNLMEEPVSFQKLIRQNRIYV